MFVENIQSLYNLNFLMFIRITKMRKIKIKTRKVSMPSATLRKMKPGTSVTIKTRYVKTSILRVIASKLKEEGYEFSVTEKGLRDETIVLCIKSPVL